MTAATVAWACVEVSLDQAEAFEAFTAEIGDWYVINRFTVPDHTTVTTVRIEPHVGGRLMYVDDPDTGDGVVAGRITRWDPPLGLTFVDASGLDVAVIFEPTATGCRVTVDVRGFDKLPPDAARRARRHSWHRHLLEWFHEHTTRRNATS
ncbi:hypothetical protein BH20ACT8_BH20ACT8_07370 [soil metagenome]